MKNLLTAHQCADLIVLIEEKIDRMVQYINFLRNLGLEVED